MGLLGFNLSPKGLCPGAKHGVLRSLRLGGTLLGSALCELSANVHGQTEGTANLPGLLGTIRIEVGHEVFIGPALSLFCKHGQGFLTALLEVLSSHRLHGLKRPCHSLDGLAGFLSFHPGDPLGHSRLAVNGGDSIQRGEYCIQCKVLLEQVTSLMERLLGGFLFRQTLLDKLLSDILSGIPPLVEGVHHNLLGGIRDSTGNRLSNPSPHSLGESHASERLQRELTGLLPSGTQGSGIAGHQLRGHLGSHRRQLEDGLQGFRPMLRLRAPCLVERILDLEGVCRVVKATRQRIENMLLHEVKRNSAVVSGPTLGDYIVNRPDNIDKPLDASGDTREHSPSGKVNWLDVRVHALKLLDFILKHLLIELGLNRTLALFLHSLGECG